MLLEHLFQKFLALLGSPDQVGDTGRCNLVVFSDRNLGITIYQHTPHHLKLLREQEMLPPLSQLPTTRTLLLVVFEAQLVLNGLGLLEVATMHPLCQSRDLQDV